MLPLFASERKPAVSFVGFRKSKIIRSTSISITCFQSRMFYNILQRNERLPRNEISPCMQHLQEEYHWPKLAKRWLRLVNQKVYVAIAQAFIQPHRRNCSSVVSTTYRLDGPTAFSANMTVAEVLCCLFSLVFRCAVRASCLFSPV